jgi:hypothetical protein
MNRGKLSGKRTVIHHILWRELFVRPPKGKAQSIRAAGNLSGKRTGELRDYSEAPFFLGVHYHDHGIGGLLHGAITELKYNFSGQMVREAVPV